MSNADRQRDDKVTAALGRLGREGESVGGRALPDLPLDPAAPANDGIEIWGRRIGRTLGWAAVVFLLFQLMRIYGS
jgi:hypothetical protein